MNIISQGKSPVYYELRAELDIFFMNYNFHFKKIHYTNSRYLEEIFSKINQISLIFQAKQLTYLLYRKKTEALK